MNWRYWIGRTLLVLALAAFGIVMLGQAVLAGAFGQYGWSSGSPAGHLWFAGGVLVAGVSWAAWVKKLEALVWLALGVIVVALLAYFSSEGWTDFVQVFIPTGAVIGAGLWLGRYRG